MSSVSTSSYYKYLTKFLTVIFYLHSSSRSLCRQRCVLCWCNGAFNAHPDAGCLCSQCYCFLSAFGIIPQSKCVRLLLLLNSYTNSKVVFFTQQEEESANKESDSDTEENDEKGLYDKAGKLKKMKHEQLKENEADQVMTPFYSTVVFHCSLKILIV